MENFALALKSTIDKILYDTASVHGYNFYDLDGSYQSTEQVESENTAIAWSLSSFTESPRDPFWNMQFEVNAVTSNDASQYESLKVMSLLQQLFSVGSSFYIGDYSGVNLPTSNLGEFIVSWSGASPAAFDRTAGLRPLQVMATVQRFP